MTDASGNIAGLTSGRLDEDPALSPDRLRVLFSRKSEGDAGCRRDLYVVRVDGTPPELLVRDDPSRFIDGTDDLAVTCPFHAEFFPDGRRAAFSLWYGRGEAIIAINLKTKEFNWVTSGFGYSREIVPRGPFAGDIIVSQHRYREPPDYGTFDECLLVDGTTGKRKVNLTSLDPECAADSPLIRKRLGY